MLSPSSFLLPLLLAPLTVAQTLSTVCTLFTPIRHGQNESYTQTSLRSYKIFATVDCPSNTTAPGCTAITGGFVSDSLALSLTTYGTNSTAALWSLIRNSTNGTFESIDTNPTTRLPTSTFTVDAGSNGHVVFTPTHRCVNGTLGGCDQQPEFNGVVVEACAPIFVPNGSDGDAMVLEGTTNFVVTDMLEAGAVNCNPANTTLASDAPDVNCQHQFNGSASGNATSDMPANAAGGLRSGFGGMMAVAGIVGVMFVAL
ncbi:hypothetical protein LTR95_001372 [Oleoguttula sp. CCFEE 5521]